MPVVQNTTAVKIYNGTLDWAHGFGAYSHGAMITFHAGFFVASWKNAELSEDAPGQRVPLGLPLARCSGSASRRMALSERVRNQRGSPTGTQPTALSVDCGDAWPLFVCVPRRALELLHRRGAAGVLRANDLVPECVERGPAVPQQQGGRLAGLHVLVTGLRAPVCRADGRPQRPRVCRGILAPILPVSARSAGR